MQILALVLFAVLILVLGPFATIWSLNTLFPVLNIEYTFWTWLAVIILVGSIKSNITVKKEK